MTALPHEIYDLDTPCLVLDMNIVEQNLKTMQETVSNKGKAVRPHIKTHKCSKLAKKQIESGAIGVCVAKLSEAEKLVEAEISDILITGPIVSENKIRKLAALLLRAPSIMVVVDNPQNILSLETALGNHGIPINVLLDVDVGLHRTGVQPAEALGLADLIDSSKCMNLCGIQAYAGQVQHIANYEERKDSSLRCLQPAVDIYKTLREKIPGCSIFSTSGTGTFDIDVALPEITELQVGSYVCMDVEYLSIGSHRNSTSFDLFQPALRLLSTVVSNTHTDFVTVDAGLKSLYRDGGHPKVLPLKESDLRYDWFGDEYGRISGSPNTALPTIGSVVELVTSHCDPTINLHDRLFITRGKRVVDSWAIDLRGCSR
ncbi:MAG: DSD1 family PLP-dependent enzyme [Desulforhopalus sp.]